VLNYAGICTSASDLVFFEARIYHEANIFDRAEKLYRQAIHMEPQNLYRIQFLAWFLIDKEIDVNEGMDLTARMLKSVPDDPYVLDTKGWGLYKQGKVEEALQILKRSWDLMPIYDHDQYLHILEVEQALASQKNAE